MAGHGGTRSDGDLARGLYAVGGLLLVLDLALTALCYDRLPETIAVHWSASGVADNAGHRDLIWLGPMCLAFVVALGLVSPRHTNAHEQRAVAVVVTLGSLYLFSLNLLALLANIDDSAWQQGSVAQGWMLLALTAPALVFTTGLLVYRSPSSRQQMATTGTSS